MPRTVEEGRTCAHCASPIVRVPKRGPLPTFCTSTCANSAKHAEGAAERAKNRLGLVCVGCGVTFDADRWKRKFCNPECRTRNRRR